MGHLLPVLGTILVLLAATDRGTHAVRLTARAMVGFGRGFVDYLRALGRWYLRTAFGPSANP